MYKYTEDGTTISRTSTHATTGTSTDQSNRTCKPRLSLPMKMGGPGRDRSPGLQWGSEEIDKNAPRCLVMDYVLRLDEGGDLNGGDLNGGASTRQVQAQEIRDIRKLKLFYHAGRPADSVLRVFHVQNWMEATKFLSHVLRLTDGSDLTGQAGFSDWLMQKKPQRRAGKPLLVGKSWKVSSDPWRRVTKTAMGLDYMRRYTCSDSAVAEDKSSKVHALMGYDTSDNPIHRYEVYSQRMAMYVQQSIPDMASPGPDVVSPYHSYYYSNGHRGDNADGHRKPSQDLYENGNVIVVFDNADSGCSNDTLIPARGEIESRWRRLPFYLAQIQDADDATLLGDCMRIITSDVLKAVALEWEQLLDAAWEHVSILEEKIYENPADESRAPELWKNSAHWLKYEKLMNYHTDVVENMRAYLVELDGDFSDEGAWLRNTPADFARLSGLIEEDLVKRTANLADLMYKSVGIRDSRQSLQLGTSMWRLSWIAFVFLPLTFITGFFGMNVDTFSGDPSIKWYFAAVVPFMVLVLVGWYVLKHLFARHRQDPLRRGSYERLFADLHAVRPDIWSRQGPREYLQPRDWRSRLKWQLIVRWTAGKATRTLPNADDEDSLGVWKRLKRWCIHRWTPEIELMDSASSSEAQPHISPTEDLLSQAERGEIGLATAIQESIGVAAGAAAPIELVADGIKRTSEEMDLTSLYGKDIVAATTTTVPSSGRNSSGMLIEERNLADGDGTLRQEHPGDSLRVEDAIGGLRSGRSRTR